MLCSSRSSAKPCLPAMPQQATPAASAFLGAGGGLVLLSYMSQLPRLICSAQSRVAFPAFALCGLGGGRGGLVCPSGLQTRKAALACPCLRMGLQGEPTAPGLLVSRRCPEPPSAPPPSVTCRPSDRTTSSAQLQPSCAGPFPAEASSWAWEGPLLPAQKPVSLLSVACPAPPASQESLGLRGSRVLPPPLLPFFW